MLLGTLHFKGSPRIAHLGDLDAHVFDDAMVIIQGRTVDKGLAHDFLLNRGILGAAIATADRKRYHAHQREQAEAAGSTSATELAQAVEGAELLPFTALTSACLKKGLGPVCKLTFTTVSGRTETWQWNWKKNGPPPEVVADMLGSPLGGRFVNAFAEPRSA